MKMYQLLALGPMIDEQGIGCIRSQTIYVSRARAAEESVAFTNRCLTRLSDTDLNVLTNVDMLVIDELDVDVADPL